MHIFYKLCTDNDGKNNKSLTIYTHNNLLFTTMQVMCLITSVILI